MNVLTTSYKTSQVDNLNNIIMVNTAIDIIKYALDFDSDQQYHFNLDRTIISKYRDRVYFNDNYFWLYLTEDESMNSFIDLVNYIKYALETKFLKIRLDDKTDSNYKVIKFKLQDRWFWPVVELHLQTCENGKCRIVKKTKGTYENYEYELQCEGEPAI